MQRRIEPSPQPHRPGARRPVDQYLRLCDHFGRRIAAKGCRKQTAQRAWRIGPRSCLDWRGWAQFDKRASGKVMVVGQDLAGQQRLGFGNEGTAFVIVLCKPGAVGQQAGPQQLMAVLRVSSSPSASSGRARSGRPASTSTSARKARFAGSNRHASSSRTIARARSICGRASSARPSSKSGPTQA